MKERKKKRKTERKKKKRERAIAFRVANLPGNNVE